MRRSFLPRILVMLVSSLGLIIGCSGGASDDGGLPKTTAGSPEQLEAIQKKLEQEKVAGGAQYKAPPGVRLPQK